MLKENFIPIIQELFNQLKEPVVDEYKSTLSGIKEDFKESYAKFLEEIKKKPENHIIVKEFELLDSSKLLEIAKENIIASSNEVYAWKKEKKDATYIYLAYGKDKELLTEKNNKFIAIKAQALKKDLINLFKESELIILK